MLSWICAKIFSFLGRAASCHGNLLIMKFPKRKLTKFVSLSHQMNDSGKYENRLIIYDFFTEKGDKIAGRNLAEDLDDVAWVRLRKYLGCSIFAFKYMAKTS